jgi:hypothetical protein
MEQSELEIAGRRRVAAEKVLLADLAGANPAAVADDRHFIAMRYLHCCLQPKLGNVYLSAKKVVTLTFGKYITAVRQSLSDVCRCSPMCVVEKRGPA